MFCFELQAPNRIKEPKLRALMSFIREPTKKILANVIAYSEPFQLWPDDVRVIEERFQIMQMIGIYWGTIVRWMMMRVKRDVVVSRTPLF